MPKVGSLAKALFQCESAEIQARASGPSGHIRTPPKEPNLEQTDDAGIL